MARAAVANGVSIQACTPHIMPGVYNNNGPQIRDAVARLQEELNRKDIKLHLTTGADVHIAPNLVGAIKSGQVLTLHDTRYILIELPHHIAPPRADTCFLQLLDAGYTPIFTHPERLSWIPKHYDLIAKLFEAGAWMQITAGSLSGRFGTRARDWSERMLKDGFVHILASDTHNLSSRPPDLASGWQTACAIVGEDEARRLVVERPYAILSNVPPATVPQPHPVTIPTDPDREPSARLSVSGKMRSAKTDDHAKAGFFDWVRNQLKN